MDTSPQAFTDWYAGVRETPVYVILGVQGAGTNLLGRLLHRLYDFSVLRDRSIVFRIAASLGDTPAPADVERAIQELERALWPTALARKLGQHVIRDNEPYRGLPAVLRAADVRSAAAFAHLVYAYRAFTRGCRRFAIKSDDLWEHVHLIDRVIPNRRTILLTRDFRDNLMSISGKEFGPVEPIMAARYVQTRIARYAPIYRADGPRAYHLTFETLLNDTRTFVDDFSRHFALEPTVDPDVAVPALKFRPNKIGKWRKLSPAQLAMCEAILRDELLEFGYPLESSSPQLPGQAALAAAAARDAVRRVPQKVRRLASRLRS